MGVVLEQVDHDMKLLPGSHCGVSVQASGVELLILYHLGQPQPALTAAQLGRPPKVLRSPVEILEGRVAVVDVAQRSVGLRPALLAQSLEL
jgi:hypothetical protein